MAAINDMKNKRDALNPDHPQWAELNSQLATLTAEYKVWVETQKAIAESTQKHKMKRCSRRSRKRVAEVAKRDGIDLVIADNRDPLPPNLDEIDVRTVARHDPAARRDLRHGSNGPQPSGGDAARRQVPRRRRRARRAVQASNISAPPALSCSQGRRRNFPDSMLCRL